MPIKIDVEDYAGVAILKLEGQLGEEEGLELVAVANERLNERGAKAVVNLSGVPYMTSAGISALVRVVAQANTQEQQVVFANPTPFVAGVFATTQLNKFFAVYPGVDEAVLALRETGED